MVLKSAKIARTYGAKTRIICAGKERPGQKLVSDCPSIVHDACAGFQIEAAIGAQAEGAVAAFRVDARLDFSREASEGMSHSAMMSCSFLITWPISFSVSEE